MNNIYNLAEKCLYESDKQQLPKTTHHARQLLHENSLSLIDVNKKPLPIVETLFPNQPILLPPRQMPRRKLDSPLGKAAFFHALAHIEFIAIYLAWDIIYRFRGLPAEFYTDWLKIADEEAQHFEMIRLHLQNLGLDYGDLPAHGGLWNHAENTADCLLARLAVVPRCMEARGLDVTPAMMEKLRELGDTKGLTLLERIYQDEIGHVERGSYWFNYFALKQGLQPELSYTQLVKQYFKGKPKGPFNREVRIIAGFSHTEIDWLEEYWHEEQTGF